jgi:hypothetical protein
MMAGSREVALAQFEKKVELEAEIFPDFVC